MSSIVIIGFLLFCFRSLFLLPVFSGGDYINLSPWVLTYYQQYAFYTWNALTSLGYSQSALMYNSPYAWIIGKISLIPFLQNGHVLELLAWWIPFFLISFIGLHQLIHIINLKKNTVLLSFAIFITNTYILLILSGGQIAGIGIGYALFPFVLARFIVLTQHILLSKPTRKILQSALFVSIIFSLQLFFDPRTAYISIISVLIYLALSIIFYKPTFMTLLKILGYFVIVGIFITALHAYWVIPTVLTHQTPLENLGSAYTSQDAVKFFSFAKFEQSFSLLHPNWPENIFGKVSFMKPEFILLPILAFSSILFIKKKEKNDLAKFIIFLALIGLVGAFLGKGTQDPFGNIYLWLFSHIPGFGLFRDPTKWYFLTALSYSVLIPFALFSIAEIIAKKSKTLTAHITLLREIISIIAILYLAFLIRPALTTNLPDIFTMHQIPHEYTEFKNYMQKDASYGKVLWVPTFERYGYYSPNHPAIYAQDIFRTQNMHQLYSVLKNTDTQKILQEGGFKYIIVPYDATEDIFIKDRKYSEYLHKEAIEDVTFLSYAKIVGNFKQLHLFKITDTQDHIWITNSNAKLGYVFKSPIEYIVYITSAKKGDKVIFSDAYDSSWHATVNGITITSQKYNKLYNSFILPQNGTYTFHIAYISQQLINVGLWISFVSLAVILVTLFALASFKA